MASETALRARGLLDLPGEIRNRIYELASKEQESIVTLILPPEVPVPTTLWQHRFNNLLRTATELYSCFYSLIRPCDTRFEDADLRKCASDWADSDRLFLGLTQTCRQLRAEFYPIYIRNLRASVPYTQIEEYLDTFVFQGKPAEEVPNPACSILLLDRVCLTPLRLTEFIKLTELIERSDIRPDLRPGKSFDPMILDITRIVRLCKGRPGIGINFVEGTRKENLAAVAQANTNPKWWDCVEKVVSMILLMPEGSHRLKVQIIVKPEFRENWMEHDQSTAEQARKREWAQRLGLDFLKMDFDVVVDM